MQAELPVLHQVLEALQQGASHDALVCCAGYVLGEYGRLVPEVPTHVQFALLHERFLTVSNETKVGCDGHLPVPLSLSMLHMGCRRNLAVPSDKLLICTELWLRAGKNALDEVSVQQSHILNHPQNMDSYVSAASLIS